MADPISSTTHLQEVNEEIYKRNIELSIVNKTLSLLKKLYQISLLSLDVNQVASQMSEVIREDLNMEGVAVILFDSEQSLARFKGFSQSERFAKAISDHKLVIPEEIVMNQSQFQVDGSSRVVLFSLAEIVSPVTDQSVIENASASAHVKEIVLFPLHTANKPLGMLLLAMNRCYEALNTFEQDALQNLPNVVALAMDKAMAYSQLATANQKLEALDKARAEFITIASHQLRTPPSTIKWYVSAILAGDFGPLSEELRSALERVIGSNDVQISTIDDLLNTSRIERGKLEFFFAPQPIVPLLSSVVQQMQPQAEMKGLQLVYRTPTESFADIVIDKEKIRQVLINIIDNAIKYTKQGRVTVKLSQTPAAIRFQVTDTGKGVEKSDLAQLFEKYTRGKDSVTHANGLGLGMYVAKIIIDQHNGRIWAESDGIAKGSSFIVEIPKNSHLTNQVLDLTQSS